MPTKTVKKNAAKKGEAAGAAKSLSGTVMHAC